MSFAMFDLSGTPTIQKKKEAPAQRGVYELTPEPFLRPAFRLAEALPQRRARERASLDPQHWPTIVSRVLSNNLGTLGGILSRLTGM